LFDVIQQKNILSSERTKEICRMPKVSVIIPTYNRAEFLRSAIESVLEQSFANLEIIVSDDKSTDHTRELVKSFKDDRIKYILNKGKKGPSATRNTAILASEGEYIAFLDDDDEWLPDKLERQVQVLDKSQPNICGVYSKSLIIDRSTDQIISTNPANDEMKGNLLYQLAIKNPIHTPTAVIRKKCLEKVGLFDETISYMEDRDLWIRLSMHWDFEYISEPLAKIYVHGRPHLSQSLEGQTAAMEEMLERYKHLFKKNKKSWGALYLCLGAEYCQLAQMKKGRENIIKGIIKYPFSKIAYFHFFSSLLGPRNYQRLRNLYKSD
jgi:glycosyltransferase involved in cell wall biosynthesis